jgi:exonuclease III
MGKEPPMGPDATRNTLRIVSINIDNIKSNTEYLQKLLEQHPIVCVQEHWLYNFEKGLIENLIPDCRYAIKCSDDYDHIPHMHKPKGVAGVATIWRADVDHAITELGDGGTRVLAIQASTTQGTITLINTYLPANGSHDSEADYPGTLDEVNEISEKYSNTTVIWAGDLNGSFRRKKPSKNDKLLRTFCTQRSFSSKLATTSEMTYHHFAGGSESQIDHIMSLTNQHNVINKVQVDSLNPANTSPHDAVIATLNTSITRKPKQTKKNTAPIPRKPNWIKADLLKYAQLTDKRLASLISTGGLDLPNGPLLVGYVV